MRRPLKSSLRIGDRERFIFEQFFVETDPTAFQVLFFHVATTFKKRRGSKRRTEVKEASKRGDEVDKFLSSYEEDRGKKRGLEHLFWRLLKRAFDEHIT